MNIVKARNNFLATLLLALMAMVMLPGCSTTEEEPAPSDTSSDCNCPEGDLQCKEACVQDLPI